MGTITKEYYDFLQSIGIPYQGNIYGYGTAYCLPMTTSDSLPVNGSISNGIFLSQNYISTVIPDSVSNNNQSKRGLDKEIFDYLTRGGYFLDPLTKTKYPITNNTTIKVEVNDNNIQIIYDNGSTKIKHEMNFDQLVSFLKESPAPPTLNIGNREFPNIDYLKMSKEARKVSGYLLSAYPFFENTEKKIRLYNKYNPRGYDKILFLDKRIMGRNVRLFPGGITMKNSTIMNASKYLKWGGRGIAGAGIVLGGIDIANNGLNVSNGLHMAMATMAVIPCGVTQGITTVYFLSDMIVTFTTGKGIGEHIQDAITKPTSRPAVQFIDSPIILQGLPIGSQIHDPLMF